MSQRFAVADCYPKTCTEAHVVVTYHKVIVATTFPCVKSIRNKKPHDGAFFNWLALSFLSASTSALAENKHTPHHHPSHYAPFAHTMLMVLVAHSAGNAVGSSAGSSVVASTMRTNEHSRLGAL